MNFFANPPLSLYVHLPWCGRKCPYCDFNSHQADGFDETAYIRALIDDLQQDLPLVWGRQIHSIFIGGGTPSLFSAEAIHQLMSDLRACLNFSPAIEITLEANPGSADESRFRDFQQAGINRLSLGIQSLNDASLQALGRIHNRDQALSAVAKARQAGFNNINLDLMYGLPGQSLQQAMDDLAQLISLQPEHISQYQLTIEPNTLFDRQPPEKLPDNDVCWRMQRESQLMLSQNDYAHYEISAYARNGHQSRHNLNYWMYGDYMGIGAGAHGKITLPAEQRVIRRVRSRQPELYLQQQGARRISHETQLNAQDLVFEFMLNALRLVNGFDKNLFTDRTGLPFSVLQEPVNKAVKLGLLSNNKSLIKPTSFGLQFHNNLQAIFLGVNTLTIMRAEPEIHF